MESSTINLDYRWTVVNKLIIEPKSYVTRVIAKDVIISTDELTDDFVILNNVIITGSMNIVNTKVRLYNGIINVNDPSVNSIIYIDNGYLEIYDSIMGINNNNNVEFAIYTDHSDVVISRSFIISYNIDKSPFDLILADNYKLVNSRIITINNDSVDLSSNYYNFNLNTYTVRNPT